MRYSVYNYTTRQYDYFDGPGPGGAHAGAPPMMGRPAMGATPEQASWPLPPSAVKVGAGKLPQGRIASAKLLGLLGLAGVDDMPRIGLYAAAAYLAWRFLR